MRYGDHLQSIRVFVEAARTLNFTAAGQHLNMSKSGVGKSIAHLEMRLGNKLFYRSTRQLSLTPDGEAYYASCSHALAEIEDAEATMASVQRSPSGRVRIDAPAVFGRKVLLPLLAKIVEAHPALRISLSFTDRMIDPVAEGTDLVIRFGEMKDSVGLIARKLTEQRRVIFASPRYLERRGVPQAINDLAAHDGIIPRHRESIARWIVLGGDGEELRVIPRATHEVGDGEAVIDAAIAGLGVGQMPSFMVQPSVDAGLLVEVLKPYSRAVVPVYALWPRTRHLLPKVRVIVDELAHHVADAQNLLGANE